jgi:hypothetical protein
MKVEARTGKTVNCRWCKKEFYLPFSEISDKGNCCSTSCSVHIRQESKSKRWVRSVRELIDYRLKSEVLHCDICGNNYLFIEKYRGECYLCIDKIKQFTYNISTDD